MYSNKDIWKLLVQRWLFYLHCNSELFWNGSISSAASFDLHLLIFFSVLPFFLLLSSDWLRTPHSFLAEEINPETSQGNDTQQPTTPQTHTGRRPACTDTPLGSKHHVSGGAIKGICTWTKCFPKVNSQHEMLSEQKNRILWTLEYKK